MRSARGETPTEPGARQQHLSCHRKLKFDAPCSSARSMSRADACLPSLPRKLQESKKREKPNSTIPPVHRQCFAPSPAPWHTPGSKAAMQAGPPLSPLASRLPVLRTRAQEPHPRQKIDCNAPISHHLHHPPCILAMCDLGRVAFLKKPFPGTPLDAQRSPIHTTLRKQQANLPQAPVSCTLGSSLLPSAHFSSGLYKPKQ